MTDIKNLIGKTLKDVRIGTGCSKVVFVCEDDSLFYMFNFEQACGNDVSVTLDEMDGEWADIIGDPILLSEEVSSDEDAGYTWTFYKIATVKGYVHLRWQGRSNGYYSESVELYSENDYIPTRMRE